MPSLCLSSTNLTRPSAFIRLSARAAHWCSHERCQPLLFQHSHKQSGTSCRCVYCDHGADGSYLKQLSICCQQGASPSMPEFRVALPGVN
jgi:hypothetical protein